MCRPGLQNCSDSGLVSQFAKARPSSQGILQIQHPETSLQIGPKAFNRIEVWGFGRNFPQTQILSAAFLSAGGRMQKGLVVAEYVPRTMRIVNSCGLNLLASIFQPAKPPSIHSQSASFFCVSEQWQIQPDQCHPTMARPVLWLFVC